MSALCKTFDFLIPKNLLSTNEAILLMKCDQFQMKYSDIIGPNFSLQFVNLYHLVLPQLTETWSIRQLCKEMITKFGVLECDLTEVYTAMLLFHTIPVTSAAAERSFSKLKIINFFLRNKQWTRSLPKFSVNCDRK